MFDNPGTKLKKLAWVLFCVNIGIIALIILIVHIILDAEGLELGNTGLILQIVFTAAGVFASWVTSLLLSAAGELVEDTHAIRIAAESRSDRSAASEEGKTYAN